MVVVEWGNVLHCVKWERVLSGMGNADDMSGEMSSGNMSEENARELWRLPIIHRHARI